MWEKVADDLRKNGVNIYMNKKIVEIELDSLQKGTKIKSITIAIIIFKFKKFFILNYLFFEKIYIKSEHQTKAIIKMMISFLYI